MIPVLPIWAVLMYALATCYVVVEWLALLFTIVYHHWLYPHRLKRRYSPSYLPTCLVIAPCKGLSKNTARNLAAFLNLDYPAYSVIFCVESETDLVVPVISELVHRNKRARLVVAGLATTCAQKNQNLLAAVRGACPTDVLVFGDSDIAPGPHWLAELVLPLSDPTVAVATSFYWVDKHKTTLGEFAHAYISMYIYIFWTTLSFWTGLGVWGGATAIRRVDFDALGVAARWAEADVDDICLSQILMQHHKKSVLVPTSITHTDSLIRAIGNMVRWCTRQILFVKSYHRKLWLTTCPLVIGAGLIYAYLPLAVAGALSTPVSFWEWGGGAGLILWIGDALAALLFALLGPTQDLAQMMLLAPLLRLAQALGYVKTIGIMTITWSGVRYTFDKSGKVILVER